MAHSEGLPKPVKLLSSRSSYHTPRKPPRAAKHRPPRAPEFAKRWESVQVIGAESAPADGTYLT